MKPLITILLLFIVTTVSSQYNRFGSAVNLPAQSQCGYGVDCYRLTGNFANQSGSAWSTNTLDLRKKIDGYICI